MYPTVKIFYSLVLGCLLTGWTGCTEDTVINDVGQTRDSESSGRDSADSDVESDIDTVCLASNGLNNGSAVPVDFLIVADNSAGMEDEIRMVQEELPALVTGLRDRGVDIQLTLISGPNPDADEKKKNGICMAAPLGSGVCPEDSNPPLFMHIPESIASKDALTRFHASSALWLPTLRENSQVHLMVVSDDDADISASGFIDSLAALSPPLTDFYFHAISASMDKAAACDSTPPLACCETAMKTGAEYQQLALQTGGVSSDLCQQDFAAAFGAVETFVITSLCQKTSIE